MVKNTEMTIAKFDMSLMVINVRLRFAWLGGGKYKNGMLQPRYEKIDERLRHHTKDI